MNTAFSRYSFRIVFREPGRGWLSCRRDRHLTSSSEGREHKSNHCSLLPTAEWGVGRWHRWHNSALDVRHIRLHSCGKISWLNLVGLESAISSIPVVCSTNWATYLKDLFVCEPKNIYNTHIGLYLYDNLPFSLSSLKTYTDLFIAIFIFYKITRVTRTPSKFARI